MNNRDINIVSRAISGKKSKKHECKTLQEAKADISVETIGGRWYWIFWGEKNNSAHNIVYCPYCGEKLEKEEDHES